MADDDRSPDVAAWLEVDPLDDVTRRRLVSTALRESEAAIAPPTAQPSRTWRWLAAAAVIVILLVGGLAILTSEGGNDTPTASRQDRATALAPEEFGKSIAAAPDVGDFGDLDDAANLAALRTAIDHPSARQEAPQAVNGAGSDTASAAPLPSVAGCIRSVTGTVVAHATGTIDGHPVTVLLVEADDGTRSIQALFQDSCTGRDLGAP
jgi:hypothetical protein